GLEGAVDHNVAVLVYFYADVAEPEVFCVRAATRCETDGFSIIGSTVGQGDVEVIACARDRLRPDSDDHSDAAILKNLRHNARRPPVHRRGEPVGRLGQRHSGTQRVEDGGEFDPDWAATHNDDALGQGGEVIDLVHVEHRRIVKRDVLGA